MPSMNRIMLNAWMSDRSRYLAGFVSKAFVALCLASAAEF